MLTEIQAEYTQRLQNETYKVFAIADLYFDRIGRLDTAKATLEKRIDRNSKSRIE